MMKPHEKVNLPLLLQHLIFLKAADPSQNPGSAPVRIPNPSALTNTYFLEHVPASYHKIAAALQSS